MVSRTLLAGILTAAGAFAQMTVFPKPSFFREEFRKPDTNVEIEAPARLKDFVKEGEACQAAVFKSFSGIAEIVPAALHEEVVIHGALALARDAFHQGSLLKAFVP